MEFFERAHIPKRDSSKRDSKSEEKVKKQLKQMLYGFKKSDNEIIKNVANEIPDFSDPTRCLDDSVSVSGFSDLNLTDSSIEAENTQNTIESHVISSTDLNELDGSDDKVKIDSLEQSISEYNDGVLSLTEGLTSLSEGSDSNDTDDISLITSLAGASSTNDSGDSVEFDPDGNLAKQIFTKLNENKTTLSQKLKSDKLPKSEPQVKSKKIEKKKTKKNEKSNKHEKAIEESFVHKIEEPSDDSIVDSKSVDESAFISISAADMPDQSLGDILGDYRHPTVKNLPSDKLNIIYSSDYSGAFETDEVSLQSIGVDEDIDSLIPEVDDDITVEDLMQDTDVNTSTEPLEESTSNYDNTLESYENSAIESDSESYSNPVKVYYGKKCCVFVLKHPAELYIHGKVKLRALAGTVEGLGYTLKEDLCELYAPKVGYAHCLKTVKIPNTYYGLFSKLTSSGISVSESEEIVISIGSYDGVICIHPLKSHVMDYVETQFTAADLFSKPTKYIDKSLEYASELLGCSLYISKPYNIFEEPLIWEEAIDCGLRQQSRGLVCGGKGTGKSTFLRYYVNRLLSQGPVVVIDLDIGQAEFTPAGNVSVTVVNKPLLGPSFTHLKTPELMLHVAMVNAMDKPSLYMASIHQLYLHLDKEQRYKEMPWVINTMGMCNSMGLRMITGIITTFRPTFVMQLDSKNIKRRFDHHLHPDIIQKLYEDGFRSDPIFKHVPRSDNLDYKLIVAKHVVGDSKKPSLSARDARYLNFLAHFGELAGLYKGDLLSIVPYEVSLKDLIVGSNVQVPEDSITKVINGKIVALCELHARNSSKMDFSLPIPCHGYGLVRGVDFEKGLLYLVTGVAAEKLSLVNTAVYSDWSPELRPSSNLPAGTPLPYRSTTQYHQRQLIFPPRRRFNPVQLLKMSRSS